MLDFIYLFKIFKNHCRKKSLCWFENIWQNFCLAEKRCFVNRMYPSVILCVFPVYSHCSQFISACCSKEKCYLRKLSLLILTNIQIANYGAVVVIQPS